MGRRRRGCELHCSRMVEPPHLDDLDALVANLAALPTPTALIRYEDATYMAANAGYAALVCLDVNAFAKRTVAALGIWRHDPAIHAQLFEQLKRASGAVERATKIHRADGRMRRVQYQGRLIRCGEERFVIESLVDIEGFEQTRASLVAMEAKFDSLFRGSPDGICIMSLDGTLIDANPRLCEMMRSDRGMLVGRDWATLHTDATREQAEDMRMRTRAGTTVDFDTRLHVLDGPGTPARARVQRVDTIGEPVLLATVHDGSARQALQQQLLQSQKMEAIGRLASGVSHDFNNILTVIRGLAFVLQDALPPDHEEQETVEELDRAAQRAAGLTRQLLVFSRRKDADRVDLDVGQVLRDLNRMLRRLVPATIDLAFDYGEALPLVNADPGHVEHLIAVLAVRAKEQVRTGSLRFAATRVESQGAPSAALVVEDRAFRVSEEDIRRFNEASDHRTELARTLRLSDALETVQRLRATMMLRVSEEGHVLIEVRFPPSVAALDPGQGPDYAPKPVEGNETVLLAEDEASLRDLVATGLRRYGYTVLTAGDPVEALSVAEAHDGRVDLLITDLVMPRGTGAELAARLRVEHASLRVLFVSGYAEEEVLRELPDDADSAFIQKVFTQEDLLRAVREILDKAHT